MRPIRFIVCFCREFFDKINAKVKSVFFVFNAFLDMVNWKQYFVGVQNIQENCSTFRLKNGLKYLVRAKTKDKDIFGEIVFGNQYSTKKMNFPENSVVIDVGAQIGIFSVFISKKAGKLFAFEPVLENYNLLLKNIELNKLENKVTPFNLVVSDKKEKQKIYLNKENTGGHSIYGTGGFVEVQTTTIPEIIQKNNIKQIDLLKMDIEGGEYKIFYSLPDELFRKIKRISMECHKIDENKNKPEALIGFLKSKGFRIKSKTKFYGAVLLFAERH